MVQLHWNLSFKQAHLQWYFIDVWCPRKAAWMRGVRDQSDEWVIPFF